MPNRVVIVNSKYKYVYLTQGVTYSSEKKRTIPNRVLIGKMNDESQLIPNTKYFELFDDEELIESVDRCDFVSIGPHLVVDAIFKQNQLYELLNSIFEDNAEKILDLAAYMIMSENNVMNYFENYGYKHSLFNETVFSDSTIGRLFQDIKVKDIDTFVEAWVKLHIDKQIHRYSKLTWGGKKYRINYRGVGTWLADPTLI